jgi:SAM-dependent methyltransferase
MPTHAGSGSDLQLSEGPRQAIVERLAYSAADSSSLVVQALCRDLTAGTVNLNIHADDEMLLFFMYAQGQPLEHAVAAYLESGKRIWATLRSVIAWRFGSPAWGGRILDFASGYGRVTRHLVAEVPRQSVWVSDIYAEGVAFQERQFGVHGVVSMSDPEQFRLETVFDCILVSSLFTHLAEARFVGWLRRLGSLLSAEGILLFSVHDLSLRKDGATPAAPASGIMFDEMSESGSLAAKEYGTSWVSETFVRSAIARTLGDCAVLRVSRGLANYQDLYVVLRNHRGHEAAAAFSGLRIDRPLDGFVEHCSRIGPRGLRLSGWVGDRVRGRPPEEVRIRIDGALVASCRDLQPRPTEVFAADPMVAAGWQATVAIPETADVDAARLTIRAASRDGAEVELYADSILAALLRSAQLDIVTLQQHLRQEAAAREALAASLESELAERDARIDGLRQRIDAMEASRFWKARNLWFRLKRLAGLTREP